MPQFYYKCRKCGAEKRRIFSLAESKESQECECGYAMERDPRPPSSAAKETLDNGIMTKKLERYTDAEELFHSLGESEKKAKDGH